MGRDWKKQSSAKIVQHAGKISGAAGLCEGEKGTQPAYHPWQRGGATAEFYWRAEGRSGDARFCEKHFADGKCQKGCKVDVCACFQTEFNRKMRQKNLILQDAIKKYQSFRGIGIFYLCKVWEIEGNPSYRSNLKKLNIRFNFVKLATKMNKFSAKKGRKRHIFLFIVPKMICCLRNWLKNKGFFHILYLYNNGMYFRCVQRGACLTGMKSFCSK